ncbi:MAG: hypothetical protein JXX28_08115 [Deltaproteobacteria bacterium]|nr:hypothetical protein [Deltaproteobacteria bacterium]
MATLHVEEASSVVVEHGTLVEALLDNFGFGEFVDMDLTSSQTLQNQGVEPGDIQDVRLEWLELEATAPEGADLSFLEAMTVSVSAPDLPEALLATAPGFPVGQALVRFEVEDLDLTDYVVSQSMSLTTDVSGSRPDEDTEVTARFSVAVGVTTQGIKSQL